MYRPYSAATMNPLVSELAWTSPWAAGADFRSEMDDVDAATLRPPFRLAHANDAYSEVTFQQSGALAEEVSRSLAAQRHALFALQQDWDGYGAPALDRDIINRLITDVAFALVNKTQIAPDLIPGGDGSIQAEWRLTRVEATFRFEADGERYFRIQDRATGEEWEYFEPHALCGLVKWSSALA
jgi:hypothetical protein